MAFERVVKTDRDGGGKNETTAGGAESCVRAKGGEKLNDGR